MTAGYNYDPYGRLLAVKSGGQVIESRSYDSFGRTVEHTTLNDAGDTVTTSYAYDPLDRTTSKTAGAGTSAAETTEFDYLGLSSKVIAEEIGGQVQRSYTYSAWGQRLSMLNHDTDGTGPETEQRSFYGYNPHTDVETLTTKTGETRATYGYTAYGSNDTQAFTGIDTPQPDQPGVEEPYNPYRFNHKRFDANSGSYDMGFRSYDPGLNRFTSRDLYLGARANMGLTADGFTGNRYAFTAGNPISRIELDGHLWDWVEDVGEGIATAAEQIGGFFKGAAEAVGEMAAGAGKAVWNGMKTLTGCMSAPDSESARADCKAGLNAVGDAASALWNDPLGALAGVVEGVISPIMQDWKAGNYGEAAGRAAAGIATLLAGGLGLKTTSKVGKGGKTADAAGGVPRFITTPGGVTIDRQSIRPSVSAQKQGRHVLGASQYKGGSYFNSIGDAQAVLEAFHDGTAQIMSVTKAGHIKVRFSAVTGYNNNPRFGIMDQPTNTFIIKGSASPSVVPYSPR